MFKGVKISILDFPLRLTDQRSSLCKLQRWNFQMVVKKEQNKEPSLFTICDAGANPINTKGRYYISNYNTTCNIEKRQREREREKDYRKIPPSLIIFVNQGCHVLKKYRSPNLSNSNFNGPNFQIRTSKITEMFIKNFALKYLFIDLGSTLEIYDLFISY